MWWYFVSSVFVLQERCYMVVFMVCASSPDSTFRILSSILPLIWTCLKVNGCVVYRRPESSILRCFEGISSISASTLQLLQSKYVPLNRSELLPCCLDSKCFKCLKFCGMRVYDSADQDEVKQATSQ